MIKVVTGSLCYDHALANSPGFRIRSSRVTQELRQE